MYGPMRGTGCLTYMLQQPKGTAWFADIRVPLGISPLPKIHKKRRESRNKKSRRRRIERAVVEPCISFAGGVYD
jgi:hypothetical protein